MLVALAFNMCPAVPPIQEFSFWTAMCTRGLRFMKTSTAATAAATATATAATRDQCLM